jgi:hypothetical protein
MADLGAPRKSPEGPINVCNPWSAIMEKREEKFAWMYPHFMARASMIRVVDVFPSAGSEWRSGNSEQRG